MVELKEQHHFKTKQNLYSSNLGRELIINVVDNLDSILPNRYVQNMNLETSLLNSLVVVSSVFKIFSVVY